MCVHDMYVWACSCDKTCMNVRGLHTRIDSVLSFCESRTSDWGRQAWWKVPSPTELYLAGPHLPFSVLYFIESFGYLRWWSHCWFHILESVPDGRPPRSCCSQGWDTRMGGVMWVMLDAQAGCSLILQWVQEWKVEELSAGQMTGGWLPQHCPI